MEMENKPHITSQFIYLSITMADSNRIVFPDEVADAKANAVAAAEAQDKTSGGDSNTLEEAPKEVLITTRNMITVPSNCPPGYKMGADGVCREVFN
ncbi:hypothetical protein PYW08_003954 [Mythimna loreyi]|uniref:Uncharacterized protein n=1 Tax=Mythimna loreyi TaxID=667449 RepID=A0ACC2QUM5_9NEOP|nr:hypothetical protein PYW08_003954 [Mythimna loreyi]